ncbi:MAG: DNA-binding protein [Euryarchaeota archaeon]|nr:DNA-binding protein [Euryarchaeota archaeon]|tara:strand:- start:268 stop:504 length:237 start_codon:yes stop_codon:yes gene_type:complete
MKLDTKTFKVLSHLKKHKFITPVDAYKQYGSMRLSAIILVLREKYDIVTHMETSKDRFGNKVRYANYEYKGELDQANL